MTREPTRGSTDEGEAPVSTTDLDKQDIGDPSLEAENALSVTLFTYLLWGGWGTFAVWIVTIAVIF